MSQPILSLIVLRTSRIEVALAFYRALGCSFVEEKHGAGPVHYSSQVGTAVLEIYPGEAAPPLNRKASGATTLGLSVDSVDTAVSEVERLGAEIVTAPKDSPWGRRALVIDPDGRGVELNEPKKNQP